MQAILMAGGEGKRLRPITAVLPKPLIPIGDISFLEMALRQLRWYGFEEVVLCVGPKAELVMAVVGDGRRFGLRVRYYSEERPLGTIGALARLEGLQDDFLVMNGDVCTDLNFGSVLKFHLSHGVPASISAYRRREKLELGVLEIDPGGERLVGFEEKPDYEFWVAMGVNAFSKRVLDLIPSDEPFGFDGLMTTMLAERCEVRVFRFNGFWLDIGRPDDYERMLDEFPRRRSALLPDEGAQEPKEQAEPVDSHPK